VTSPSSPYRSELAALRERKETLEREIAQLREQTLHLDGLREREKVLQREIDAIAARLGTKRGLPLLDQVRVASPCRASWEEMVGNDQVRFCMSCEKNVYNLSAMPRDAAERFLEEQMQGDVCVRFYKRADGTLMTSDCPVGATKKRRKKLAIAVAGAGAMALAATALMDRGRCSTMGKPVQGEIALMGTAAIEPTPPVPTAEPAGDPPVWKMGEVAPADPAGPPVAPVHGRLVKKR
jgi:hypothetical protein